MGYHLDKAIENVYALNVEAYDKLDSEFVTDYNRGYAYGLTVALGEMRKIQEGKFGIYKLFPSKKKKQKSEKEKKKWNKKKK